MVQMKGRGGCCAEYCLSILYIPHGSDERRLTTPLKSSFHHLYIPHGSDESRICKLHAERWGLLYIPHGSDESVVMFQDMRGHLYLYIPHGSDESEKVRINNRPSVTFISHMVQMKAIAWILELAVATSLYPTWFR